MVVEEKRKRVEDLKKMIEAHKVIGIINMHKMPSMQLQQIRKELRGKAAILMVKKSILKFALEKLENNELKRLENEIEGQPAIILSDFDVFKLYIILSKLKFPAFGREGDIAPHDIRISAGPTTLMPGPVIGELQRAHIPAGIEEGKIVIRKDTVVVKGGEALLGIVSSVLRKLNIKPMEVGLNVVALIDGSEFYPKSVLELVNVFPSKLGELFNGALNLSVVIAYPTKENIKFLLGKCFNVATAIKNISGVKVAEKEATEGGPSEQPGGVK